MIKSVVYKANKRPDFKKLKKLFVAAFSEGPDAENFTPETDQVLKEWFDFNEFKKYLKYGKLVEARFKNKLVGAVFVARQNPMTWPDGNKAEGFILAVLPEFRNGGIGRKLISLQEIEAKKFGSKKIILNTHILLKTNQNFFMKLGYRKIGVLKNYYSNGDAVFFSKDL